MKEDAKTPISMYDFMCLFSVLSTCNRRNRICKANLLHFIQTCNENHHFTILLENFSIEEWSLAIQKLEERKILTSVSSQKEWIHIFEEIPIAELMKNLESYFGLMASFYDYYMRYEDSLKKVQSKNK